MAAAIDEPGEYNSFNLRTDASDTPWWYPCSSHEFISRSGNASANTTRPELTRYIGAGTNDTRTNVRYGGSAGTNIHTTARISGNIVGNFIATTVGGTGSIKKPLKRFCDKRRA